MEQRFVVQGPEDPGRVLATLQDLLGTGPYGRIRASFAFANRAGTVLLTEALAAQLESWDKAQKQWLVSFDFGFSHPAALKLLGMLPNSEVRVPDATWLLSHRLAPRQSTHPKSVVLDTGSRRRGPTGLLVGSGNLTAAALTTNREHAIVQRWDSRGGSGTEEAFRRQAIAEAKKFDDLWAKSPQADDAILAAYADARKRVFTRLPWRDQDETNDGRKNKDRERSTRSLDRTVDLAVASALWIEAGNMYANRGDEGANQVDLPRGSRVFFGFSDKVVPRSTLLGEIEVVHRASGPVSRNVWFANNSMDKVYLPVPGGSGPPRYERRTLLFRRLGDMSFELRVGTPKEVREWKAASAKADTSFRLRPGPGKRRGRAWGIF
jgi:HKD family nuclease